MGTEQKPMTCLSIERNGELLEIEERSFEYLIFCKHNFLHYDAFQLSGGFALTSSFDDFVNLNIMKTFPEGELMATSRINKFRTFYKLR